MSSSRCFEVGFGPDPQFAMGHVHRLQSLGAELVLCDLHRGLQGDGDGGVVQPCAEFD